MAVHWSQPTCMLVWLVIGALFTIGHHVFYSRLDGSEVPDGYYALGNISYAKQQANLQIGTLLALMAKTCLVVASSIAYVQIFWQPTVDGKPVTIDQLDTTFGALRNMLNMLDLRVWLKRPGSWLIALICWLIPLVAIVTPSTLSISLARTSPVTAMESVPYVDFKSLNFPADMPQQSNSKRDLEDKLPKYSYNGPSSALQRVVTAVSAQGAVLPITPPEMSSCWQLLFNGPALSCKNMDSQTRALKAIANYNYSPRNCAKPLGYLAWTSNQLSLNSSANSTGLSLRSLYEKTLSPAGQPASLYIAALPAMWGMQTSTSHEPSKACSTTNDTTHNPLQTTAANPLGVLEANSTLLECSLFNATYHVKFNFTNGDQTVDVAANPIRGQEGSIKSISQVYGPDSSSSTRKCTTINTNGKPCVVDNQVVQTIAYQSVMDAFNQRVVGGIAQGYRFGRVDKQANSSIMTTVLLQTPELKYLQDSEADQTGQRSSSLQSQLSSTDDNKKWNLVDGAGDQPDGAVSKLPLARALEALFRNVTVSLMSSTQLQQQNTVSSAKLITRSTTGYQTEVTTEKYHSVYVYAADKLWLSYGLAIAFAIFSVFVGFFTIFRRGLAYDENFSTVLRTTRWASVVPEAELRDAGGATPVPDYLKKARVAFVSTESWGASEEIAESKSSLISRTNTMRSVNTGVDEGG